MHRDTLQGNVLEENDVWLIQEGDTKFRVESTLGTAIISDPLRPNRVEYVQQVHHEDTGIAFTRGVIIDYDEALRVQHIERFGFEE